MEISKIVKEELQCQQWLAEETIKEVISRVGSKTTNDAFFICDLGEILKLYQRWLTALPNIQPFYAVKCNPSIGMIKTLASLGCNFDCASKNELQLVLDLGIAPERIIYAHPCKNITGLKYAKERGVNLMTFDSANELDKIHSHYPEAQLVIRVATDDSHALIALGSKFGAHPDECSGLLQRALELRLNVVGISFHVGSGCSNEIAFSSALTVARKVFDEAKQLGINIDLINIGGGYTGRDEALFKRCANVIRQSRDELFGKEPQLKFIAEPGRYFASTPHTLALCVIGKKATQQADHIHFNYYLGDGVYGSLNSFLFAQSSKPTVNLASPSAPRPLTSCTLFGPTCDSLDVIYANMQLPELEVGEWVYFLNYGAYTSACGGSFNGIETPPVYYFSS